VTVNDLGADTIAVVAVVSVEVVSLVVVEGMSLLSVVPLASDSVVVEELDVADSVVVEVSKAVVAVVSTGVCTVLTTCTDRRVVVVSSELEGKVDARRAIGPAGAKVVVVVATVVDTKPTSESSNTVW